MKKLPALAVILLALVVVYQVARIAPPAGRDILQIRANLGREGLWRSAYFHRNLRFAEFVAFLQANIPPEARVVLLPAEGGSRLLGNTPIMQFFLAPREVLNCTQIDCLQDLSQGNTVVVLNAAGQQEGLPAQARLVTFDESWGLAILDPELPRSGTPLPVYHSLAGFGLALVVPFIWMALLVASGAAIVRPALPDAPLSLLLPIGLGFSLVGVSLGLAVFWLLGIQLAAAAVLTVSAVLLAWGGFALARQFPGLSWRRSVGHFKPDPWLAGLALLGGLALVVSAGRGFMATDEVLLWGAKGRGLAASGDLSQVTAWGTNTVAYPLHLPLMIAACELLFIDGLTAFKLVPALYGLSLAALLYSCLVRWGVRRTPAGLSTLLVVSSPLWFRHATLAYANLPLAFNLLVAALLLVDGLPDPNQGVPRRRLLLSGWFLAGAAWTRPEGLWLSAGVLLAVAVLAYWRRDRRTLRRGSVAKLAWTLVPLLAYGLFWLILQARVYTGNLNKSSLVPAALDSLASGSLHGEAVLYILGNFMSRLISPEIWGWWGVCLVFALAGGLALKNLSFRSTAFGLAGAICLALVLGMYYVTSFDTVRDLSWWVSTGLDRMLMPALLLLWVAGVLGVFGSGSQAGG